MPSTSTDAEGRTWVEVDEVELVPETPWRHSFRRMTEGHEKQLRLERARLVYSPYEVPGGGIVYPPQMSDGQLQWVARRLAERDVQGAIREKDSVVKTALHKRRRGEGV